ncbi:hypothetical protein BGZ83_012131 [Gryganskiella cystojenkinii]|nr:hypothetical protein BGZ83_012131 [Gryganskiella cystojenkinii]
MHPTHLHARRRRLVWFTLLSSSFLALLFFRDHQHHVHQLRASSSSSSSSSTSFHSGDSFTVGSKVSYLELAQQKSRFYRDSFKAGKVLRYRIKSAPERVASRHDKTQLLVQEQQVSQGQKSDRYDDQDMDINSAVDDHDVPEQYEYFWANPGSLKDKIFIEEHSNDIFIGGDNNNRPKDSAYLA